MMLARPHLAVLERHEVVPVATWNTAGDMQKEALLLWATWYEVADRQVALDRVDAVEVSTVFMGITHRVGGDEPPLWFETMVFGGDHDGYRDHYATWEQAERGHERVVTALRAGRSPEEGRAASEEES